MANELWNRVMDHWRQCNIQIRPGAIEASLSSFENRYRVALPFDFREYVSAVDGTGDDMEDMLYRFWPLAEIRPVHEVLADTPHFTYPDRFSYPDCFVFADHCISCWDYAVRFTLDPNQSAPVFRVTASEKPGEMMASSFREFMTQYANDPRSIL